ncbi:MAG TPA: hypothetical protein VH165_05155 [Kofleriaceae bacterium]|nr:hypothetical protein [Kofleriaceae bacterium]
MWWTRYWSAPGGRIAAAVVRIALAIAELLVLDRIRDLAPVSHPGEVAAGVYHPVGILQVFRAPPPAIVIELAWCAALGGALAMLVGLWTRAATALTALGALIVASQAMSYQPSWSHDLNVVLLALVAFLGARGGDALALDVWIRRRPPPAGASYQWSLRLVQLAVGLMFLSACVLKLRSGGVAWALSDNLRHQLLARYDLTGGTDRPAIVDWLLARSWRYEGAALLNLISQAMPLFAIVFVDRPRLRALAALCFVTEVAALYCVMELGNPSWFPLAAVFIDWDRLWHGPSATRPSLPVRVPRAAAVFVTVFVVLDVAISFTPGLDQALRSFPFSRFPMFSTIRAKRPYGVHQTCELIAGRIEVITGGPPDDPPDDPLDSPIGLPISPSISPEIQAEIDRDYVYRALHRELDPGVLRARVIVVRDELRRRYPALAIRGVRVYITMYQAPAYPAPARLAAHDLGVLGELVDDTWTSHYVALPRSGRISIAADRALAGAPLALYRDGLPAAGPPPVPDAAGTLALPPGRDTLHLVAALSGADGVVRPYLVARRTRDYW